MEKNSYLELKLRILAPPNVVGKVKDIILETFNCEPQANGSDLLVINGAKEKRGGGGGGGWGGGGGV